MKRDKKVIVEIRHYDENYDKHTDEQLVFFGCISVILTENQLRVIEHENAQTTHIYARTKFDAVTVRNWGNKV